MREKVLQSIRERRLLRAGDRVAVAVSGGADSVALLRVLLDLRADLGIVLSVAHLNHSLRSEQSDADEAFVADLAKHHGLEFFAGHGDVRDHAFTSKLSIEAAGRELRYRWFAALAGEQRLDAIATAHTSDDQAETVLLKFLRGAGSKGLAGIYPAVALRIPAAQTPAGNQDWNGTTEDVPLRDLELSSAEADSNLRRDDLDAGLKAGSTRDAGQKISSNLDVGRETGFTRDASGNAGPTSVPETSSLHPGPSPRSAWALRLGKVIRPLLTTSRQEVEAYLTALGQSWREDESNLDRRFLRNRVRHELLPLLEREFNPNVRQTMSDLAEIARGEEEFWQERAEREVQARGVPAQAAGLKPDVTDDRNAGLKDRSSTAALAPDGLDLDGFAELPVALQRRVLKRFAERRELTLDFEHVESLRRYAVGERSKVELPGGRIAQVVGRSLSLCSPPLAEKRISYRYLLPVPGETHIAELNLTLRAEIVPPEFAQEVAPGELLSLDLLTPELSVRNWLPGDRFWPSLSRSEEKLKRLFAEKRIPAAQRPTWPVVVCGEDIVWVRAFPVGSTYRWRGTGAALRVAVTPGD